MTKKLLICGGTGLLGPYIAQAFEGAWDVHSVSRTSEDMPCDFTDAVAVRALVDEIKPDAVIHLIALTDVEGCEQDPVRASDVNAGTVRNVVQALGANTHFTYISTDQVYPDIAGPHVEGSEAPVNAYGISKLEGEKEASRHINSLSLRVNLFGPSQTNGRVSLSDFFIKSFKEGAPITMFDDVLFSPLHMKTLAGIVRDCVDCSLNGTYNLGSRDGMDKAAFALKLADHLNLNTDSAKTGQSSHVEGRAQRPKDLRINTDRIENVLDREMPTLEEEIKKL